MEKVPIGVSDEEEIIENPPVVKKVKQMKKKKYRLWEKLQKISFFLWIIR